MIRPWWQRAVVPALLAVALTSLTGHLTAGDTEDGIEAPFAVRQAIADLYSALGSGDPAQQVDQALALAAEFPEALIPEKDGSLPLSLSIRSRFIAAGLGSTLAEATAKAATRAYQSAGRDTRALERIVAMYPGAPAARLAARALADRAWEAGRLPLFIDLATVAGDLTDGRRGERLAFARTQATGAPNECISALMGLDPVWAINVGAGGTAALNQSGRTPKKSGQGAMMIAARGIMAVNDSKRFVMIESMSGRVIDSREHNLEGAVGGQMSPVVVTAGFVTVINGNRGQELLCLDDQGSERWRTPVMSGAQVQSMSSLVVNGSDIAVLTSVWSGDSSRLELSVFAASNGALRWRRVVQRSAVQPWAMNFNGARSAMLQVIAHGGGWLVMPGNGTISHLDGDGRPLRQWTYASSALDEMSGRGNSDPGRQNTGCSRQGWAVLTPSDSAVTLLIGPDQTLRTWRGDGAKGNVVAMTAFGATGHEQIAIIAGKRIVALDPSKATVTWISTDSVIAPVTAYTGRDRIVVTDAGNVRVLNLADGKPASPGRGLTEGTIAGSVEGLLVQIQGTRITAHARSQQISQRLLHELTSRPQDPAPAMALGRLAQARNDQVKAIEYFLMGHTRGFVGAGNAIADILRARLEPLIGDPAATAVLTELTPWIEADERAWWSARDALERRKPDEARAALATITGSDRELVRGDGMSLWLNAGISALRARIEPRQTPAWMLPAVIRTLPGTGNGSSTAATIAWSSDQQRGDTRLVNGVAIAYSEGLVKALRLSDGSVAWQQAIDRPLLGIQAPPSRVVADSDEPLDGDPATPARGVSVGVVQGSAAAQAGLRSGDVLLKFNGGKVDDFERDLRVKVAAMKPGDAFTVVVHRAGVLLTLSGKLGGQAVAPIDSSPRALLLRTIGGGGSSGPIVANNQLFAIDTATGQELFRFALAASGQRDGGFAGMVVDDVAILAEGDDLIGMNCHVADNQERQRWRLPGFAARVTGAVLLGGRVVWLPEPGSNRAIILDPISGQRLAMIPNEAGAVPVVDSGQMVTVDEQGIAKLWDLARGRLMWSAANPVASVIAMAGDQVLVIDKASAQLQVLDRASGAVRRTLGEWNSVAAHWGSVGNPVVLSARRDNQPCVIGVDLTSGTVRWQAPLPAGCELQSIVAAVDGAVVTVRSGERQHGLRFNGSGQLTAAIVAPSAWRSAAWAPLQGGVLLASGDGLRVWPLLSAATPKTSPAPKSIRAVTAGVTGSVTERFAAAAQPDWQALPDGGRFAVAVSPGRDGGRLLLAVEGAGQGPIRFVLSDTSGAIDTTGVTIQVQAGKPAVFTNVGENLWRMNENVGSAAGRTVIALTIPNGRPLGSVVRIRAIIGDEPAVAPWWLTAAASVVEMTP